MEKRKDFCNINTKEIPIKNKNTEKIVSKNSTEMVKKSTENEVESKKFDENIQIDAFESSAVSLGQD